MLNKKQIIEKEREIINKFFNIKLIEIPDLPTWVTDELIQYWNENIFHIHYIPRISLDESLTLPLWKNRPSKIFYRKIREEKLSKKAKVLSGKWILIDGRDKPAKKVPWVRVNDIRILQKIGFKPKNYLKKWKKQSYQDEYLADILAKKGFGSRFCLTIKEINNLKPFILDFLKIDLQKNVRFPFFIEYNYLVNTVYKQWRTTETWEWFEDKFDRKQNLAGGSKSAGCVGWEPPEFWSTILTFRPVIEL